MYEIWLPVVGYEGRYEISSSGRVRSINKIALRNGHVWHYKSKLLRCHVGVHKYKCITLRKKGETRGTNLLVHRMVAEAFIPNPALKRDVNHINGDRLDNRVANLEWCTPSENNMHAFRHLGRQSPWLGKYGKDNPRSKAIEQTIGDIVIAVFHGLHEAERETGIDCRCICNCLKQKSKTAGGYTWRYKNEDI